jgi:diguanylate cyclase (GGDEF)-like protein
MAFVSTRHKVVCLHDQQASEVPGPGVIFASITDDRRWVFFQACRAASPMRLWAHSFPLGRLSGSCSSGLIAEEESRLLASVQSSPRMSPYTVTSRFRPASCSPCSAACWVGRRDRLAELATTDALTGLQNARALQDRLQREVARAVRYRQPLSLLLIDLDGLKVINDRLGHPAGDRALLHVADAIRVQLRASDIGSRWGGDEFALLAPNTRRPAAAALAQRVQSLVGHAPVGDGVPPMTVSIGMATFDPDGAAQVDASSLMKEADTALYGAKRRSARVRDRASRA